MARELSYALTIMGFRVAAMVAKFALTVFIARFIGLEALGFYGVIFAIVALVPTLYRAGFNKIIFREAVTQSPQALTRNLVHYGFAMGGLYLLSLPILIGYMGWSGLWYFPFLVFILIVVEHIVGDWFQLLIALSRPLRANILLFTQAAAWMGAFMISAYLLPDLRSIEILLLFWVGGGLLAIGTTCGVWLSLPWLKACRAGISRAWYRVYWRKCKYFYISDVAEVGSSTADRFIVSSILGLDLTGVYVLFWQFANAVHTLVWSGVGNIYRPRLIQAFEKHWQTFPNLFKEYLWRVGGSALVMSLLVGICGYIVIPFIDRPLVVTYMPLLMLFLLAVVIRLVSSGVNQALFACQQDQVVILGNIFLVFCSMAFLGAGLLLFGMYAGVGALICAQLIGLMYRGYFMKKTMNV